MARTCVDTLALACPPQPSAQVLTRHTTSLPSSPQTEAALPPCPASHLASEP
ncbi:hypothetical protein BDN67DRAFT_962493 [Paxillus ammoniavirescens]|nr:hypothetical protein BDN67DRAFT_962493 [Paxillus ammoniavirescens]